MTDTPRTQAELLSIFADQQDHGITAQDMRDFVVSSPPMVVASRFAPTNSNPFVDLKYSPIQYDPGSAVDPEGWFTDEVAYDSGYTDAPVPQGGLMRLPPGWYDAFITQAWKTDSLASGADVHTGLTYADDPSNLDPIFGGDMGSAQAFPIGIMSVPPPNPGLKFVTCFDTIRIPSRDLDDNPVTTWPVAAIFSINHQGTDQAQHYGQILIRRIGAA